MGKLLLFLILFLLTLPTLLTIGFLIYTYFSGEEKPVQKFWRKQILIGYDQLFNTYAMGWADETISSRAYRLRFFHNVEWAARLERIVDALFFWQVNHCKKAYEGEMRRDQFPPDMRIRTNDFSVTERVVRKNDESNLQNRS